MASRETPELALEPLAEVVPRFIFFKASWSSAGTNFARPNFDPSFLQGAFGPDAYPSMLPCTPPPTIGGSLSNLWKPLRFLQSHLGSQQLSLMSLTNLKKSWKYRYSISMTGLRRSFVYKKVWTYSQMIGHILLNPFWQPILLQGVPE